MECRAVLPSILALVLAGPLLAQQSTPSAEDTASFANHLLSSMSVAEKVGQLEQAAGQCPSREEANELTRKGAGTNKPATVSA